MASNVTPSIPGAPLLLLGHPVGFGQGFHLADVDVQSPERQDGSAFALTYILRLRSCKLMGAFVISPLPPVLSEALQTAGPLRSTDITPLPRYYGPIRTLSSSADFPVSPVIRLPCSAAFASGRGGFLQLLGMSLSPCCRYHPAGVTRRVSHLRRSMLPSPE